jgi:hypothetical protein
MRRQGTFLVLVASLAASLPAAAAGQVLRVGSYRGIPGQFRSIQRAVDAARPGDWVLVGPGDYKTSGSREPAGETKFPTAVLMTTPHVYLRGMNRNTVVVDGTKPGTPACSSSPADQNYGPSGSGGPSGLNGIMVWKAADDWVQNLTACNFLGGSGDSGNEIWWNGGADTGRVGGHGYFGSYLNATSTFFHGEASAAKYGIFSSNWSGGTWDQTYASNFNDSGYYIGACQQVCDQTINHAWSQYSALGYSGTNSGGRLLIENSQFDHNQDGFDTNSQNADEPAPQNGACPAGVKPPVPGVHTCWVFTHNYVHDNNNPNVPAAGSAAAGPVGTGMSIAGARNDTVINNRFENNNAWGLILVPYPDNGPPCTGGTQTQAACVFDEWGIAVIGNTFGHNGGYGNPSNGDIAAVNTQPGPTDCYSANTEEGGGPASTSPSNLQQMYPSCTGATVAPNSNPVFLDEVACDSGGLQFGGLGGNVLCPPGANYPRHGPGQPMPALPAGLPSMPNVCSGVSPDPWCSGQVRTIRGCAPRRPSVRLRLAVRERFVSVSVTVGRRRAILRRAHGARTRVRLTLGTSRHRRRVRVRFRERIRVGRHRETVRFTRIYELCAGGRGNV